MRVLEDESCDIPKLVREMLVSAYAVFGELEVHSGGRTDDEGETRRISSVFFHHMQRIADVAKRLRHLASLSVAYEAMEVDVLERHFTDEESRHQYHACDPEKQNVVACFKDGCRVERRKVGGFFRP